MIAPTDTWGGPAPEEPAAGPPEPDHRPAPAPAGGPAEGGSDQEERISFWDALMRCLAAVHS